MDKMVLKSEIDDSINYVQLSGEGKLESRYVNRHNGYSICYLSSHNGCNQGCQFCHLTKTRQTMMVPADIGDFASQILNVLETKDRNVFETIHFNFMARGEPLLNRSVRNGKVFDFIHSLKKHYNFEPSIRLSTIMPKGNKTGFHFLFGEHFPMIYYSWYSDKPKFREKWLPNAIDPRQAFLQLNNYFLETGKEFKVHYALIKDENDFSYDVSQLEEHYRFLNFKPEVNLVRYNAPDENSEESDLYNKVCKWINEFTTCRIIERVGFDVKASCGMFVS